LLRRLCSVPFYNFWLASGRLRSDDSLCLGRGLAPHPTGNKANERQEQCREDCQNRPQTDERPRETLTPINHTLPLSFFLKCAERDPAADKSGKSRINVCIKDSHFGANHRLEGRWPKGEY